MTPKTTAAAIRMSQRLQGSRLEMPGIVDRIAGSVFAQHIVDSLRYARSIEVHRIRADEIHIDPNSDWFHPLKAAAYWNSNNNQEEAFWLTFLATHFGEHHAGGWRYLRDVYGRRGAAEHWTWAAVTEDFGAFSEWLTAAAPEILKRPPAGGFGNHRKYASLKDTVKVVESYLHWVQPITTQAERFETIISIAEDGFDALYRSLNAIYGFGRLAKFDYLSSLRRLGIVDVTPRIPYLSGATGPLSGARLLFDGNKDSATSAKSLSQKVVELGAELDLGMDILEDSLCNWQKSPDSYKKFNG